MFQNAQRANNFSLILALATVFSQIMSYFCLAVREGAI